MNRPQEREKSGWSVSATALLAVVVFTAVVVAFQLSGWTFGAAPTASTVTVDPAGGPDSRPEFVVDQSRNLGPLRQIAKANRRSANDELAAVIAALTAAASASEKERRLGELPPAYIGPRIGNYALPATGTYTSGFGPRWGTMHNGVDIANSIGTPILAVADGTVVDAGPAAGFGLWVRLRHDDGTVSVYGHLDSFVVAVGQRVVAGQQIASLGNRGDSTGPHLHFEVIVGGRHVDPELWLITRGISLSASTFA